MRFINYPQEFKENHK